MSVGVNHNGKSIQCIGFIVTGLLYNSTKRFKHTYGDSPASFYQADQTNLWRGSMWGVLENGKKVLLKRVNN